MRATTDEGSQVYDVAGHVAESGLPSVPNLFAFKINELLSKPECKSLKAAYLKDHPNLLARRWHYYMALLICLVGLSMILAQCLVVAVFKARGFFCDASGYRQVDDGLNDTWAVTPIVATASSTTFFTFCAWNTVQDAVRGRPSANNGLSREVIHISHEDTNEGAQSEQTTESVDGGINSSRTSANFPWSWMTDEEDETTSDEASGYREVEDGVNDTWAVTPIVATVSSITFFTFCAWLTVQESVRGRLSANNGLSWEVWIAFVLYNSFDVLLQALARGMSASYTLEVSDLFIMDRVALLNMPILGSRMDTFKDLVFIALCFQGGLPILTFLASITLLGTQLRTWAMPHLRYEIRHDHVPILRPKLRDMPPDDMHGMPMTGFKGFVLKQLKAASLPIKQETAFLEDLPQAILQTVSLHFIRGSSFVVFSLVVACVKGGGVVFLAEVLQKYGTTSDHLTNLVSSPISRWRGSAAEALRKLGKDPGNEVLQAVKDALESDPSYVVRLTAAEALGEFGGTEALSSLKKALESDSEYRSRRAAAEALVKIGGPEALQALKNALASDSSVSVGEAAAKALGNIGGPEALQPLKKALESDEYSSVRMAAAEVLGKIGGPEALQALKRALASDSESLVRKAVAEALGKIGGPEALQPLIKALEYDSFLGVRRDAATALGKIGGPEALQALKKSLASDSRYEVRAAAAEALGKIGGPEALAALMQHFRAHINSSNWEYRYSAATAAGAIGQIDPKSEIAAEELQPLKKALESDDQAWVREAAAKALGEIGGPEAITVLKAKAARGDEYAYVEDAVAQALTKLGA